MKQTTKMSRAVSQLEHIYNSINTDFFNDELPTPIITVQSKPGSYGHSSVSKVWKRPEDNAYEINIAAEVLSYPIEETIDTMIHEMVHLYCREHGIKEVSRGGAYHNKKFKEVAEAHGLTCVYTGAAHGWNTAPGDNLLEYALQKGWSEIKIARNTMIPWTRIGTGPTANAPGATPIPGEKRPSSTRKLACPCCGQSVRATKKVNIICGDCMQQMLEV